MRKHWNRSNSDRITEECRYCKMSKRKHTTCMFPQDTTKDLPQTECNCWTSQGMWNFPSNKLVPEMIFEKRERDCFLRFLDKDEVMQEFLKKIHLTYLLTGTSWLWSSHILKEEDTQHKNLHATISLLHYSLL